VNLELEDAVRSTNLVPDRHPLLSVFLLEVSSINSASCYYVPGKQTFIQVKTIDTSSKMDLCLILKLALLSAIFDAPFIQQALEVVSRFDPQFIDRLVLFLTNSTGPYRKWIFNFQSKLYNVSRAYPLVAIEALICEQIQPKGHSFFSRVVGLAVKIKNALQKSKQMNGLFVFSIEKIKRNITTITEIEEIEIFLENLMKTINNRPDEVIVELGTKRLVSSARSMNRPLDYDQLPAQLQDSLAVFEQLETKVLELHRAYGKRHSKYHFLEYLWIHVQRLALDANASSRQIADQLLEAMKNYRNPSKSDRAIYHLPFVGHRWDSNPHQETDGLERLLESVEQAGNDSIAAWKEVENCSRLAVWIMRLRDLLVTVIDAGDRTIEETKKTRLSDLLQDSGREAELVLDLRETLEEMEMDSQSESMQSHLKFEDLYLSDLTDRNGTLRKQIGDRVRTYNENIKKAAKILNYTINGQKGLSELELHHTFRLTSATLFRRLTEKYSGITQKKRFLKTALSTELRIDLHELKEIKDDVSQREFIYSDCRVQTLIGMAKNHPLWIERPQKPVPLSDRQQFLKYFKYCPVATMMRFENSLFGLFENEAEERTENLCLKETEILLKDMNFLCPLEFVMDIHRLILLRKLHRIFQQNQTKRVISDSAQYDDVLFRILDDNSNTEKLVANCVFLAAIAENKDEKGVLKIIRISKDKFDWKKPLESIDSVKEAVEEFKKKAGIDSEINLADILAACAKLFEVELQRISK
jgi:hypothetical protein